MNYYKPTRIDAVSSELVRSALQEIMERYVKSRTKDGLVAELGCTPYQAGTLMNPTNPYFRDVAELCSLLSLDIGITIRDLEGQEVTIFPATNFGNPVMESKVAKAMTTTSSIVPANGAWDIED